MTDTPAPNDMPDELYLECLFTDDGDIHRVTFGKTRYIRADLQAQPEQGFDSTDNLIQKLAEQVVIDVRGSWDVPGFDVCVKAVSENIKRAIKFPVPIELLAASGRPVTGKVV